MSPFFQLQALTYNKSKNTFMIEEITPSHNFTEKSLTLKHSRKGDFLFFRLKYNWMPIDALGLAVYEDPHLEKLGTI